MAIHQLIRPLRLRSGENAEPGRKVTWLELFFDLGFVAAVAQVGTPLATEYSVPGLVRYAFLFLLIWWAWSGHATFSTRFDTDDLIQRLLTLLQIFVVAVMAVNAKEALDSRSSAGFAAAYAVMRFVLVAQYIRASRIAESRGLTRAYAVGFGLAAVCWLSSALVPVPGRFWLWALALVVDIGTPLVTSQSAARVPPDAAHLPERFGLFTIILIGESIVAVMTGMESQEDWSVPAALSAFLGMAVAFLVWWWYFDGANGAAERVVGSRAQNWNFTVWSFAHLPLYLGIAVTGAGVEHIIRIADDGRLEQTEAWILCCAVTLLMTALATIGATSHASQENPQRVQRLLAHYGIGAAPLGIAIIGPSLSPVAVVGLLAALGLAQVLLCYPGFGVRPSSENERRGWSDESAVRAR